MSEVEVFVEGGTWALQAVQFLADRQNIKWTEEQLTENMDKGEVSTYIDLQTDMEAFFSPSTDTVDVAAMHVKRTMLVQNLSQNMLRARNTMSEAKAKHSTVKRTIGALKFVLPASAAYFFPVLGGAMAATAVAWQIDKILVGIKKMSDDIARLTTSDYKSAMQLFKDILIALANDVFPMLADVRALYLKAMDAYNKLDDTNIEWKLELIKIQMFCTMYMNCYDQESCTILPFDKISEGHQNIIRDIFKERLKDLQHLSEVNHLEYYAEGITFQFPSSKIQYQKMVDDIDHIKKTTYSSIIIKDTIYTVKDYVVKVWSLKSFMVPEGENDALFSSLNIIKPTSVSPLGDVTFQASIYKEKGKNWILKVHLPSEEDYEDIVIICKYQELDKNQAIFLPCKIDNKTWRVDTAFISNPDGIISFFVCKPGNTEINLPLAVENDQSNNDINTLVSFHNSEVMKNGFASCIEILERKTYNVMTVIGFMNLTNSTIKVSAPALVSGCQSKSYPWPTELPPMQVANMVARKMNYSTKGCCGAMVLSITAALNIMFYWSTPYDHNLFENCFGIGFYSDSFDFSKSLLETVSNLPHYPPNGIKFVLHQARNGPVCTKLSENLKISVKMTTDHKAAIDIILHSV